MNNNSKQLSINLLAQAISFFVNFAINFFLTPFILEHVGREAYGFVSLGNNFTSYAALLSIALNSMASRFITISIHKDDFKNANQYYTSVIFADIMLAVFLSVPSIFIVFFLDSIVDVSSSILGDVQVLWALLFFSFLYGIITSTFGAPIYAANRIDIQAKRNIGSYIIRAGILLSLFLLFTPRIWYIGLATLICTIYLSVANYVSGKKLYPQLTIQKNDFSIKKVKELLSSGVWNSISRVGSIALTELDLLISNLFISAESMGTLAIVKTIPSYVSSFMSTITSVFVPSLTISFAKEKKQDFIASIRSNIRVLIFFQTIIYGGLFAFLEVFYKLWLPKGTEDYNFLYILSIITIMDCLVSPVSSIMFNIFTVTNKLRVSSITVIITGILSFLVSLVLVKYTDLGLFAIAGVSVFLCTLRNLFVLIPYGAKCLEIAWYSFYREVGLNLISLLISFSVGYLIRIITMSNTITWINFVISGVIFVIVDSIINLFIVLKKSERQLLLNKFKKEK